MDHRPQPVNVGYSYSEGSTINNTPDAAEGEHHALSLVFELVLTSGKDVYAFLQLFMGRFDEYSKLPFHIAAER